MQEVSRERWTYVVVLVPRGADKVPWPLYADNVILQPKVRMGAGLGRRPLGLTLERAAYANRIASTLVLTGLPRHVWLTCWNLSVDIRLSLCPPTFRRGSSKSGLAKPGLGTAR